jgi:hypothetical protein
MEKKAWRKTMGESKSMNDMRQYIHDFKTYEELRMTMGGWFPKDQEPPVMTPPASMEWIKKNKTENIS